MNGTLTDVPGVRVGHTTRLDVATGCTVILPPEETRAGVVIRGGGPGGRDLQLLDPVRSVPFIDAVLLTGGSAFGIAAADGVVRWLEENGIGHVTPWAKVPIVPAAVIYDLAIGSSSERPTAEDGYKACATATSDQVRVGTVGAGTGATVGKWRGLETAMKGGIGSASIAAADGLIVAALAVVNPIGDVIDRRSGNVLAGARNVKNGTFVADKMPAKEFLLARPQSSGIENTTLCVVATNADFSKSELTLLANMAHNGLARSIRPVNTPHDGDLVIALSCGQMPGDLFTLGAIAAEVVSSAIEVAIESATSLHGVPGLSDLR